MRWWSNWSSAAYARPTAPTSPARPLGGAGGRPDEAERGRSLGHPPFDPASGACPRTLLLSRPRSGRVEGRRREDPVCFPTGNEKPLADERPDAFRLPRLYAFGQAPRLFRLRPPLGGGGAAGDRDVAGGVRVSGICMVSLYSGDRSRRSPRTASATASNIAIYRIISPTPVVLYAPIE